MLGDLFSLDGSCFVISFPWMEVACRFVFPGWKLLCDLFSLDGRCLVICFPLMEVAL